MTIIARSQKQGRWIYEKSCDKSCVFAMMCIIGKDEHSCWEQCIQYISVEDTPLSDFKRNKKALVHFAQGQ